MPTSTSTSAESSGNNVPAFLSKLWRLVEDPKYDSVISWSDSGQSFTIHDQTQFAKDVLPLYFKHNNMASFIRQLNMYGFRKVVNVDSGGLKGYKEDIEFYHNYFIRGQESTLEYIKRKAPGHQKVRYRALPTPQEIPTTTTSAISAVPNDQELRTELVRELLTDVNQLQGKQEKVDTQLVEMKRENEALWREVAVLRRKHLKQQRIVEKLIHFLARLVHQARSGNPENNISMKRKHTLMLDEGARNRKILRGPVVPARQAAQPETRIAEIDSGPIISDITYEQPLNDPRYNAVPAGGAKSTSLTITAPETAPSPVAEALITSPASATDLTDEVVLCENLFDEEVDLAPCVESAVSAARNPFQTQQQTAQQQSARQQAHDFVKFDLEQTLNTPRVDWEEHQNPIPGTSSKQSAGQLTTTNAAAAAGLQIALQSPNKNAFKTDSSVGKNKDAFGGSKSGFIEDSPSRLDSNAVTEWQGGRHTITQNLGCMLSDHFNGAEQIKRIDDEANRPPEELNDHLEGVETELDWLQQQLTAGGLNIDNGTLLNIFNTDVANFTDDSNSANSNSQLVQYQDSSFFDLMDDVADEEKLTDNVVAFHTNKL